MGRGRKLDRGHLGERARIWYHSQDRFSLSIKPPGLDWQPLVAPGEYLQNHPLPDGTMLSCYNELYHPSNGANYVGIFLSPGFNAGGIVGVRAGTWIIRLHGDQVRDGRYDGWIERDDPRDDPRDAAKDLWRFPSFFSPRSNVDTSSVSSLACGRHIISVANRHAPTESRSRAARDRHETAASSPRWQHPAPAFSPHEASHHATNAGCRRAGQAWPPPT